MVRVLGLLLTAFLVIFQLWYTHASAEKRAHVPSWVRSSANVAALGIISVSDAVVPASKRTWDDVRMKVGLMATPEPAREGLLAVNEDLSGRSFATRRLGEATFLGATLTDTDFSKAYLVRSMLDGTSAHGAVFDGAIMEDVSMRTARFVGARFVGADLTAAQAQGADFTGADLSAAVLSRAQFSAATLRGASLRGANLSRTVFYRADLSGADLSDSKYLQQEQLDGACGDDATLLPPALSVKPCGQTETALR